MFPQRINDMSVQNWAFHGQEVGEIDCVGEAVGEHIIYVLELLMPNHPGMHLGFVR